MIDELTHVKWPKIKRMFREMIITEKIDGTNAQIVIRNRLICPDDYLNNPTTPYISVTVDGMDYVLLAGSRKRWLTPDEDNFGFGNWVSDNRDDLVKELGEGRHFGEWWGKGIQRGYGLDEKRFSLFNVSVWEDVMLDLCHCVPVLYRGVYNTWKVEAVIEELKENGSLAEPGFPHPEGVVVFHTHSQGLLKVTCEDDEMHKWEAK